MGEEGGEASISVVFFIVVGVVAGAVLREVNRRTKFPYTPQLLIVGLFVGYCHQWLGALGEGAFTSAFISPHLLLYVFIPVLIFESAFNCDWYIFRRSLVNIVVLAGPGVLLGAVLLGFSIKFLLGYSDDEINWVEAFTLGSVLSATDPVAVVALLKELGASVRFNTLIEGESLLNDGTAMVFYMVFVELARTSRSPPEADGAEPAGISLGAVFLNFARFALGGPVLGLAVGAVSAFFMKRIIRDEVLTTSVTFIACFLSFYLAEFTSLHVSGILSLVVLGLYLSAVGKTKIYPESEHALHVAWAFVQYVCETLIFLLTGVIIGVRVIDETSITMADWVKMVVFWVIMQFMRLVMVFSALPFLNNFGYPLSRKEFIVLVYGGLRGALGLSLALMVYVDETLPNERFRELTLFYMSGMATLTLLVNGTTCSSLVRYLKMIEVPPIKHKLYKNCKARIARHIAKAYEQIQGSRHLAMANWKEVRRLCEIDRAPRGEDQKDSIGMRPEEIFQELRYRILRETKRLAWERYEHGRASEPATRIIEEACDVQLDSPRNRLCFWELAKDHFGTALMPLARRLQGYDLLRGTAEGYIFDSIFLAYDTSNLLVQLLEELEEECHQVPVKEVYIRKMIEELEGESSKAEAYMSDLEHAYPSVVRTIHTRMAGVELLVARKHELDNSLQQGLLDAAQYKAERNELDLLILRLDETSKPSEPITFNELTTQCPLLSSLNYAQLGQITAAAEERRFAKGHRVVLADKEVLHFYLVKSGTVTECLNEEKRMCGAGQLVPIIDLTSTVHRATLVASNECTLLLIKAPVLFAILRENSAFEARILKASLASAVKLSANSRLKDWRETKVRKLALDSDVKKFKNGELIFSPFGGFVLDGSLVATGAPRASSVSRATTVGRFGQFSELPRGEGQFLAQSNGVVLLFRAHVEQPKHL